MTIDDYKLSEKRTQQPFNNASRIDTYQQLKERQASSASLRRLETRVTDIRAKARSQHAKNWNLWVDREINRISKERHKPAGDTYQPNGRFNIGPKSTSLETMRKDAEQRVENRHQQRMGRINTIYERMVRDIIKQSWEQDRSRPR